MILTAAHVSWVGSVLIQINPAQLTTAGEELNDLYVGRCICTHTDKSCTASHNGR